MAELRADNITDSAGTGAPGFPFGIKGSVAGVPVPTGSVGEVISAFAVTGNLFSGTLTPVLDLPLTAGSWDIQANLVVTPNASSISELTAGISNTNSTFNDTTGRALSKRTGAGSSFGPNVSILTPVVRIDISGPFTMHLNAFAAFGGGTADFTSDTYIRATRIA